MAELVTMPKLGFDMAVGTLVRWVKKPGEAINKGEVLAEVETDKATVEVESFAAGVVRATFAEEGEQLPVGRLIAVIAAPGEAVDLEAIRAEAGLAQSASTTPTAAAPGAPAEPTPVAPPKEPALSPPKGNGHVPGGVRASPVARRMAREAGIDLQILSGSGPGGRIVKRDVEEYLRRPRAVPAAAAPVAVRREDTEIPLTRLRQIIARRMTESKTAAPHFYVTTAVDMAAAMALRESLNALLPEGEKLSVNDFVVRAAALTLRQFPNLNASFSGEAPRVVQRGRVNIGLAVALEGGLITPVVKDADLKSLAQISAEARALIGRSREGKVKPDDIEGGTFTVSNLGMFEVEHFIAIINPPEAAILAVGAVQDVPVVKDGGLAVGTRMKATLSADHRVTDGAEAARYLQAFRRLLEEPLRLLL